MPIWLKYVLLGVSQGIFEWLPVSSEGATSILAEFLDMGSSPVSLALFLHTGTLFTVLFYFRKEWIEVLTLKDKEMVRFLIVSVPASLVLGLVLYQFTGETTGSWLLLLTGFGLLLTAYFHKKDIKTGLNFWQLSVVAGLLQGVAVIPGVSRSGSTIFGLSLGEMKPEKALRYSYMMSVPAIVASTGYLFLKKPSISLRVWPALVSSALVGFLALRLLFDLSKKINFFKLALSFSLLCFLSFLVLTL